MKKKVLALLVAIALISGSVPAGAFTVKEYQGWTDKEREAFILGMLYGFFVGSATFAKELDLKKGEYLEFPYLLCPGAKLDNALTEYINEHHNSGDEKISAILFPALREACSGRKEGP
ncbi:MAG: hypothetical protein HZA01_13180 [Nitrospinae bacterium]|nr:hypothetical protein [Nitrospinota bacterium]